MTRAFLDTNIFVYAIDGRDRRKQDRAFRVLAERMTAGSVISTQVMQEFADVAVRKFALPHAAIADRLRLAEQSFRVVPTTPLLVQQALTIASGYRLRMYDALILAAAEAAGCDVVLTEDLSHGQRYGSVLAHNPFSEESNR